MVLLLISFMDAKILVQIKKKKKKNYLQFIYNSSSFLILVINYLGKAALDTAVVHNLRVQEQCNISCGLIKQIKKFIIIFNATMFWNCWA